jgi:hypothetical protein
MGQLDNLFVSSSYQGLLKMTDSTNGLLNTLQTVQTGNGANSPLQMSLTEVNISGSFSVNNIPYVSSSSGTSGTSGTSGSSGSSGTAGSSGTSGTGFNVAGDWNSSTYYSTYDVVFYNGQTYVALSDNINKQPSIFPAVWQVFSAAGTNGTSGTAGTSGSSGSAGTSGSSGSSGTSGTSGSSGINGTAGTSGSSGVNGTSGSSGTSGSNGSSGSSGVSPSLVGVITTGSAFSPGVTGSTQTINGGYLDGNNGITVAALNVEGLNVYGVQSILPILDVSGSIQNPSFNMGDPSTGSQFPIITLNVDATQGAYSNFAGLQVNSTIGESSFGISSFNSIDGSQISFIKGFGLGYNQPYGPGSNDNILMYVKSGSNVLQIPRDTKITGSLAVSGKTSVTGSLIISEGLTVTSSLTDIGDLFLFSPAYNSGSVKLNITGSAPVSQSNFIFGFNSGSAPANQTGSVVISGSNNILLTSTRTNTLATQGTYGYIGGNNNILNNIPTIGTGSGYRPLVSNNFLNGALSLQFTTSSLASPQIAANLINNTVTLNHQSGSVTFANNIVGNAITSTGNITPLNINTTIQANNFAGGPTTLNHNSSSISYTANLGAITINNNYTSSISTAVDNITVGQNLFTGLGNVITVSGSNSSARRTFSNNAIIGQGNTINSTQVGTNVGNLASAVILGENLIMSASFTSSAAGNGGSVIVGRYNATGSLQESSADAVFVVGTGTGAAARRNAIHIDSNNNTRITGSVSISGSLQLNGSNVVTDKIGLITTGSNTPGVLYSQVISGSLQITGSIFNRGAGNQQNNLAYGEESLYANTTGYNNTALGYRALYANTTGTTNTSIGANTLLTNVSGSSNVAIGDNALRFNVSSNNTAIGSTALYNNTLGNGNLAIGTVALTNNTTGNANLAIGFNSLQNNVSGSANVAIGQNALNQTKSDNNVGIGNSSLLNNSIGTSNLALGASTLLNNTTGNNNIGIGRFALTTNSTGSNNLGIGSYALNSATGSNNISIGYAAGANELGSNNFYLNNQFLGSVDADRSGSLFWGKLDATTANQTLQINAGQVRMPVLPNATGSYVVMMDATGSLNYATPKQVLPKLFDVGYFYSTQTQSGSANVSGAFTFDNTAAINEITVSGSHIIVPTTAYYNIQYSIQLVQGAGAGNVAVWLKKDGVNVADSATYITVPSNQKSVLALNIWEQISSGSYVELAYQSDSGNTTYQYIAPSGNIPGSPSIIASINQIR